jgi:hypothetical protein
MSSPTPTSSVPNSGGGTDPSPLAVGTQFVKKYYHILSTSPADIDKFYKNSTSIITRGEGSDTAEHIVTDFSDGAAAARFFNNGDEQIRFEFEHGAIDAQFSANSAILLVVTGQVVYVGSNMRKNFVHTFFLGSAVAGANSSKRSFYVHNDILRFLDMGNNGANDTVLIHTDITHSTEAVTPNGIVDEPNEGREEAEPPVLTEESSPSVNIPVISSDEVLPGVEELSPAPEVPAVDVKLEELNEKNEAPGHGVEERKDAVLDDEETAESKVSSSTGPAAAPGSWASLVKRTAPSTPVSPPATPMRSDKSNTAGIAHGANLMPQQPTSSTPAKASEPSIQFSLAATSGASTISNAITQGNSPADVNSNSKAITSSRPTVPQQNFRPKREAECTLIIKNIDMDVTEAEVTAMFEPFIADTSANFIGCSVQGHRGIAFVDYDKPEPVVKAVKQHNEVKFMIRGKELDIYQKKFVDKNQHRGGGGSGGRFQGNANNGRDFYRGGNGEGSGRNGSGRNFRRGGGRTGGRTAGPTSEEN